MGAGMLPLAFGFAGDSSFGAPMAVEAIGSSIFSTLLHLIVIFATYSVLHDLGLLLGRWFGRGKRSRTATTSGAGAALFHSGLPNTSLLNVFGVSLTRVRNHAGQAAKQAR
jgi:hypothetical protein